MQLYQTKILKPRHNCRGINKMKANRCFCKSGYIVKYSITNYMNITRSYTFNQRFNQRFFFFSKSIPISHNPSGRWNKCQHSPWPVMKNEKEDEKEEKTQTKPAPVCCSVRLQRTERRLGDSGVADAQRGAGFCTVLFLSTLSSFFFFYLTFVSECTGVTVLLVREFSLSQLSCQSRSVLAIHGKDSAIVFSAEKDWSCNKWTAWMVLPNQPSHWLNEDLQHKCNTKYLASDLTILSLNLHYDKTVLLQLLKSDYFPGKIQM